MTLYKSNRNKGCGKFTFRGEVPDEKTGEAQVKYIRLDCKTWGCPPCGEKKAKRIKRGIIQWALGLKLNRLLTLTLDPKKVGQEDSIKYIRATWGKLRTYLKREYKGGITFIAVLELQKNTGMAHLHVLVDRYIPQPWIQASWEAVGGGRFVNLQYVDVHRIAPYLTKYLTKDMLLGLPSGTRRYTTSRDIQLLVKTKSKGVWYLVRMPIELLFNWEGFRPFGVQFDENGDLKSFEVVACLN